ncbi:MAG: AraC family transcriptional regulator ligand-binding domain-containing protein [Desulfobulbaceae bacterium]
MSDRVPTRFVRTLLRMVGDRGYDFTAILHSAGLEFDPLDEGDPAYRHEISAMQYSRVYQQVLSLLQDETFGVTGTELVAPGAFRMMCYCIISCDNLGRAIQRAAEFYRTFFDERSQLYANFTQEYARVGYRNLAREEGNSCFAAPSISTRPTTCFTSTAPAWPGRSFTRSTHCANSCAPRPTSC